jgi:DNA-binding Xre family transcriptional regulator
MMAERGINTVTELRRRLEPLGIEISTQQLNRVVSEIPQRLNTDLLAGLLTVLDCTPNDLLYIDGDAPSHEGAPQSLGRPASPVRRRVPARKRAEADAAVSEEEILGPKVAPFPLPASEPKK